MKRIHNYVRVFNKYIYLAKKQTMSKMGVINFIFVVYNLFFSLLNHFIKSESSKH